MTVNCSSLAVLARFSLRGASKPIILGCAACDTRILCTGPHLRQSVRAFVAAPHLLRRIVIPAHVQFAKGLPNESSLTRQRLIYSNSQVVCLIKNVVYDNLQISKHMLSSHSRVVVDNYERYLTTRGIPLGHLSHAMGNTAVFILFSCAIAI